VVADVLGETGLQVALRQAFQELLKLVVLRGEYHGAERLSSVG